MKRLSLLIVGAVLLAGGSSAFNEEDGWRVAVQAWTFRSLDFFETIDQAAALGFRYLEAYPGQALGGGLEGTTHFTMDEATRKAVKDKLKEAGVSLVQYGVVGGKDEAEWRALFTFAKDMGVETITSEPAPEDLDLVEKLSDEYGINIALHNHPKPSRYWNPHHVLSVLEGRSARLGVCADTGHYVRSGLDPVAVLEKVGDRLTTLHLKDLADRDPKTRDAVYGTGASDLNGQLRALRDIGFKGVITVEYEHESPALADEVAGCLAYLRTWDGSAVPEHTAMSEDVRAVWANRPEGPSAQWTIRDLLPGAPPEPELALGDLAPVSARTTAGDPLVFPGAPGESDLKVDAGTALTYMVPEEKQGFVTSAKVDGGSVVFKVYGVQEDDGSEGDLLDRSPVLPHEALAHWNFDIDLRGRHPMIRLVVENAGTDDAPARASWIKPGFVYKEPRRR